MILNKNIVLICDTVSSRENINIYSNDLEFTSQKYYAALYNAIAVLAPKVYHYSSPNHFIDNIHLHKNDVVLSAIWSGTHSRNRKSLIPAICESYGISYVGADTYVQSLCQDKSLTKLYCKNFSIEIPAGVLLTDLKHLEKIKILNFPVIIKPNNEGSSIGISDNNIADTYHDAILIIRELYSQYTEVLIEEYIAGIEIAACAVGGQESLDLFEIVQLIIDGEEYFEHKIWGLESKKGGIVKVERKTITNTIPSEIINKLKNIFFSLGKVDYMRIDGRIKDNKFYLIEFTPDCSLHPDCFMAEAFRHAGYSYNDMLKVILKNYINK